MSTGLACKCSSQRCCSPFSRYVDCHLSTGLACKCSSQRARLPLPKGSPHYPLEVALDVCRRHQLIEGQVFVLGRLGAHAEALRLMLESSQGDLRAALDFVRQRPQEVELWQVGAELVFR
jgi:hypothetical protein